MVAQHARGDVGGMLRQARERRGLSLRQISNATKIAMITLEALERNDVKRLPGGIFTRSFVRAYALEVGLDPEVVIEAFMGQFPQDSVTAGHPATSQIEDHEAVESDRRTATTFLRLLAIGIPVAAVVAYLGTLEHSKTSSTAAGDPPPAVVSSQPAAQTEPPAAADLPAAAPPESAAAVPSDTLTVQVSAARPSWISIIVDGARAVQREFKPGEDATFEVRQEMVLTAGDAGAVSVLLNGMPAKPIGGSGQVVTLRLNPSNFKNYLMTP